MSEPRWLNATEQELWLEFREFLWGFPSAMDRQLNHDAGLSSGEYSVLAAVSEAEAGRMRSGDLACALKWDRSRVSHLLRRMETKGLISRCAATGDGRGQDIMLTDSGWETVHSTAPDHVTFVRETLFDSISPQEQDQLRLILSKVRQAVVSRELW